MAYITMTDSPSYLAPLGARRDPHAPRVDLRDVRPTEHVPRGVGPSRGDDLHCPNEKVLRSGYVLYFSKKER